MGKVINSGVHRLTELFGSAWAGFAAEIKRLRDELHRFESQFESAQKELVNGHFLMGLEFAGFFLALILWGMFSNNPEYVDPNKYVAGSVAGAIILAMVVGMSLTYSTCVRNQNITRGELAELCAKMRRQIADSETQRERAIVQRLEDFAEKRGEIGRSARRGHRSWLFFSPSATAMLDFGRDEMLLVNTIDCRDLKLSFKELERRAVSSGTIGSAASKSLAGAAVGGLVFGEAGMIAGSVIGSSGERRTTTETVETRVGTHVVDIYTRLQQLPVVTIEFGDDDNLAKQYYAVISAALPQPAR